MTKWIPWIAGTSVLVVVLGVSLKFKHQSVTFHQLRDAHARIVEAGFHCSSDSRTGAVGTGFLISRDQLEWTDVVTLCKSGVMGPEWRGKVWITKSPSDWQLHSIPDDADVRVWGDVIAFGDSEMLDQLDEALSENK